MIILLALLVIVGIEGMISFGSNHSYYLAMIFSWKNLALISGAIGSAYLPLTFITSKTKLSFKRLILGIGAGLGTFVVLHGIFTKSLITLFAIIPLLFNTFLLYGLAIAFIVAMMAGGSWIARKLKLFQEIRWQESLLTFGLGLVTFLILMQILMGTQIFYSVILRLIFVGLLVLARFEKKYLKIHEENLLACLESWKIERKNSKFWWIFMALLLLSFAYYFFNFSHSYIPYSTAWDANHEYMYTPKVIAENAWILRGNLGPAGGMPYLWHGFIAFFFWLWAPVTKILNIAKDTVAINLNAFSGVLVLIFGLGVIKEALLTFNRKSENEDRSQTSFLLGWGLLLLRLTSGMGAFLVFVDNKTDMGVLALTTLALLGGLIFFNHFQKKGIHTDSKQSLKYLILSGLFFAFAVMAKPTAFIDTVIFALLLVGFWLNTTTLIGVGIAILGMMGIVQPLFTAAFIDPALGKLIFIIGVMITVIGGIRGIIWRSEQFSKGFKHLVIWGLTLVTGLFIFKGPWIATLNLINGNFQLWTFVRSTLLWQASQNKKTEKTESKPMLFLAQATGTTTLETQSAIDTTTLLESTKDLTYEQCLKEENTTEELNSTKQKAPGSAISEDIGRYVGYNRREFKKTGIGGGLLKILFRKNNACFGWDHDGVLLCKHHEIIEKQNLSELKNLIAKLSDEGTAKILATALLEANEKGKDLRDERTALETYYQEHSIQTNDTSVFIPYRYIVPLNIVFNRSLQNLSSYYTDIGLIWLCVFVLMVGGLLYAILTYNKKQKQLLFLSFGTFIWWAIRWAIGGGIVRYGLGLIVWSILTTIAFFQEWESKENKNLNTRYSWLIGIFAFYMGIQAFLNFARIASQASEGPFEHYKSNVGEKQWISENLEFTTKQTYKYSAQEIFNLQFWQYQPFLDAVKNRADEEGVLIAGTYIQYFLDNQKNLISDGMLTRLREEMSDFNSCRSYQRLKNEKLKYLIIDPNIGTVGRVGEGNESLFHRFFARLTADEKHIETHGAITMLVKMAQEGYLKLIFTNNLWAKYAFNLTDEELQKVFWNLNAEDLILLRAKIAVAKFFTNDQELLMKLFTLFQTRLMSDQGLWDIANILGKQVDEKKLNLLLKEVASGKQPNIINLSQDERLILAQYYGILKLLTTPQAKEQAESILTQLFQNSLFGSSQLISFELQ